MLRRFRRWLQLWRFAAGITRLAAMHKSCCGQSALEALAAESDWGSNRFNPALESAYANTDSRGCKLSGWQRRFILYYWVARHLHLTWTF